MKSPIVHNDETFVFACDTDDVPALGGCKVLLDDGTSMAMFRDGDCYHAIAEQCPHQRYNVMHRCHVHDHLVSCPMHGWTFDIRTGSEIRHRGRIRTYATVVVDGSVYVSHSLFDVPAWMRDGPSDSG